MQKSALCGSLHSGSRYARYTHTKIQTDLPLAGLRGSPPYSYRVMECIAGIYRWSRDG